MYTNTTLNAGPDSWSIRWINADELRIEIPRGHGMPPLCCVICGGDLESILATLCTAYEGGHSAGRKYQIDSQMDAARKKLAVAAA